MRRVVVEQLCAMTGKSEALVTHGLHCRPMGSYLRGKPSSGDIDVLVIPSDAFGTLLRHL